MEKLREGEDLDLAFCVYKEGKNVPKSTRKRMSPILQRFSFFKATLKM